jgi:hypothetical protein
MPAKGWNMMNLEIRNSGLKREAGRSSDFLSSDLSFPSAFRARRNRPH